MSLMEMSEVAKSRLRSYEKSSRCRCCHQSASSTLVSTRPRVLFSTVPREPERRFAPELLPTEPTPPLSESSDPSLFRNMLERERGWCASCLRWREQRRRVSSSSMKSMLLVALVSTTVLEATTKYSVLCWNSLHNLMVSTLAATSRSCSRPTDLQPSTLPSCVRDVLTERSSSRYPTWKVVPTFSVSTP